MAVDLLLQTKFYIPSPPAGLVSRPGLIERLHQGISGKLILISAPAGFGKTTLLAEWLAEESLPAVWLSLDEGDNDIARFLAYLAACLGALQAETGREALEQLQAGQSQAVERFLSGLINELAAIDEPFILVLDDIHYLENPRIHQALAFLLEHRPPAMHLVFSGRADPGFSLSRVRAQGQLVELRAVDLRFSSEEAAAFLRAAGVQALRPTDAAALWQRTEGWAAGLQLTALSLRRLEDTRAFIEGLTGSHEYIADYLHDEVLSGQPEAIQRFLLQTAVLDRLCGPLCDAVTGQENGQSTLEKLAEINLFLNPLDNERRWYCYHRLFADLLLQRLRQSHPEWLPELHRRASAWFEGQGLLEDAIDQALEAADFERAARLLEAVADETLMRSEFATLTGWLRRLPEEVLRDRPSLSVYLAWTLLLNGQPIDIVQAWLPEPETDAGEMPPQALPFYAYIALVQGRSAQSARLARQALARLPEQEGYLRGMTTWLLTVAGTQETDSASGSSLLEEMARYARATGNVTLAVLAMCNQGELRHAEGRLPEAQALYRRALALSTGQRGQLLPIAGAALNGLGEIARERNELAEAEKYLTQGLALTRQWSFLAALDGFANLAIVRQTSGDGEGALKLLEEALDIAEGSDFTEVDDWLIKLARARLFIAQGKLVQAWRWAEEIGFDRAGQFDAAGTEEDQSLATRLRKYERTVFARLLMADGQAGRALAQLKLALPLFERRGRVRAMIETLALSALAHQALGEERPALEAVSQALRLAQPGGFQRIFLDEGRHMARLLSSLQARLQLIDDGDQLDPRYIGRLLAGFEPLPAAKQSPITGDDTADEAIIQPLTPRELEVLALIDGGLTNQEIANRLVISLSTVKVHTRNIYAKLAVRNRAGAVSRAHDLGILIKN